MNTLPQTKKNLHKGSLETKILLFIIILSFFSFMVSEAIFIFFLQNSLKLQQNQIIFYSLITLTFLFLFILFISLFWTQYILKHLKNLVYVTAQFVKGNYYLNDSIKSDDEVDEIVGNLKITFNNLQTYMQTQSMQNQAITSKTNQFEIALSTITDAVIVVDFNRQVTVFNKAAEDITNFRASDVLGKPIGEVLKLLDKNDEISPITYCPIGSAGYEGVMYEKDGLKLVGNKKESFVNIITKQLRQGSSAQVGAILIIKDITREKQLEAMQLDFVSMAAHELRTPLTSIKGYLAVFMEENKGKFNKDQAMFLDRIDISTQRLINLIENLLNVTRVERGAFNVNRQLIDWVTLCKQTVGDLTFRASEKEITLQFIDPTQEIPKVEADKMRITEVLTNLVANAINYTPVKGTIQVSIERNQNEVITHVKDSGVGIPKEALNRLFTKFFRVSNKLEMGSKGTGLGLYISKAIIDLHHGRIWVESEVGKGSVFSFSLPIPQNSTLNIDF